MQEAGEHENISTPRLAARGRGRRKCPATTAPTAMARDAIELRAVTEVEGHRRRVCPDGRWVRAALDVAPAVEVLTQPAAQPDEVGLQLLDEPGLGGRVELELLGLHAPAGGRAEAGADRGGERLGRLPDDRIVRSRRSRRPAPARARPCARIERGRFDRRVDSAERRNAGERRRAIIVSRSAVTTMDLVGRVPLEVAVELHGVAGRVEVPVVLPHRRLIGQCSWPSELVDEVDQDALQQVPQMSSSRTSGSTRPSVREPRCSRCIEYVGDFSPTAIASPAASNRDGTNRASAPVGGLGEVMQLLLGRHVDVGMRPR